MGTHPIFESDFDCLTDRFVDFSNRIIMSASGPNIQLELRLAEMARMNEEIRRRHLEVEADKRRAQRTGGMVTRDQSITMATAMPTDFDATREDGFKDGLDSRPLPADPYGKDRVPRDKRGKPQDKITSKNSKKKQTIDEARQRGMADQEFWRQEQARADAARIKRAQGRDGTWRREWDREKNHTDERDSFSRSRGGGDKSRDKFRRGDGRGDQMSRRHDSGGPPSGGRYGGGRGGGARHQDSHGMSSRDGGGSGGRMNRKEFRNDREPRNRRGSGDDYHRFGGGSQQRGMNSRYSKPNNRKPNNIPDRPERESSESELDLKPSRDVEIKSEDSLREYSSDEGPSRRRRKDGSRNEDEPEDEDEQEIELPPSIESSRESSSSSHEDDYEEKDEIDTEILEALQAQEKAEAHQEDQEEESVAVEESSEKDVKAEETCEVEETKTEADNEVLPVKEEKTEAKEIEKIEETVEKTEEVKEESTNESKIEEDEKTPQTTEGEKTEGVIKSEEVLQTPEEKAEEKNEHSST